MATTPKIDTYANVTAQGGNPFTNATNVDRYGASADYYHNYISAFYSQTPVINDFEKLTLQIALVFEENSEIWTALKKTIPVGIEPRSTYNETETIAHTGTDTTTNGGTTTDKRNTFDNATLRTVGEIGLSNSGGITYGHTITTTKTKFDGSPFDQIEKFRKTADFNLTEIIIKTVIRAITHHIYIPPKPSNELDGN